MALLPLRFYPDPVLRERTAPVSSFDEKLTTFVADMFETMYKESGIGLAAPQVGTLLRVAVIDVGELSDEVPPTVSPLGTPVNDNGKDTRLALINPEIIAHSGRVDSEEGCLSIPEYRDTITRHEKVTVSAQTLAGEPITFSADDLLAICIQHELDHLDGVLFVDHLSRLKRELFRKRYKPRA